MLLGCRGKESEKEKKSKWDGSYNGLTGHYQCWNIEKNWALFFHQFPVDLLLAEFNIATL